MLSNGWLCLVGFVQLMGIACALGVRLERTPRRSAWWEGVFYGCLLAVGGSTAWSFTHGSDGWLLGASTLAMMVVLATRESGPRLAAAG